MKRLVGAVLVFAVTALFYAPSVDYELLGYDDGDYVTSNDQVHRGLTSEGLKWAFNCGYAANWHPWCWLSLMFDAEVANRLAGEPLDPLTAKAYAEGGTGAAEKIIKARFARIMHLHNVILHAVNSALLFLLLGMIVKRVSSVWFPTGRGGAPEGRSGGGDDILELGLLALLALSWALHPLRVEVVCWVSERKELASVLFMLLALMAHFGRDGRKPVWALTTLSLFVFALLAKPVAVTLPVIFLAWDFIFTRRIRWGRLIVSFALSVGCCVLTMLAQDKAIAGMKELAFGTHVTTVLRAPVVYLWQTLAPLKLSSNYMFLNHFDWVGAMTGTLLIGSMAFLGFAWFRTLGRQKTESEFKVRFLSLLVFGVSWVYIGLLPMIGIVKVGNQPHSDRYTYWVGCGAVVIVALIVKLCAEQFKILTDSTIYRRMLVACGVLCGAYAYVAHGYMPVWHDTTSLYGDGFRKSLDPELGRKYVSTLIIIGEYNKAEMVGRDVCALRPGAAELMATLALSIAQNPLRQDLSEADYMARRALEVIPDDPVVHEVLGNIAVRTERYAEAVRELRRAAELGSENKQLGFVADKIEREQLGGRKECSVTVKSPL